MLSAPRPPPHWRAQGRAPRRPGAAGAGGAFSLLLSEYVIFVGADEGSAFTYAELVEDGAEGSAVAAMAPGRDRLIERRQPRAPARAGSPAHATALRAATATMALRGRWPLVTGSGGRRARRWAMASACIIRSGWDDDTGWRWREWPTAHGPVAAVGRGTAGSKSRSRGGARRRVEVLSDAQDDDGTCPAVELPQARARAGRSRTVEEVAEMVKGELVEAVTVGGGVGGCGCACSDRRRPSVRPSASRRASSLLRILERQRRLVGSRSGGGSCHVLCRPGATGALTAVEMTTMPSSRRRKRARMKDGRRPRHGRQQARWRRRPRGRDGEGGHGRP